MANSRSGDAMIDRLVRVLAAFDPDHQSLSTEEIAARAELPKSTAYRLVGDMMRHDLLQRDPSGRLRIGVGMWELTNRASDAVDLASVARPHMMAVHEFVGENTQLGILREREVLIIERMSAPNAVVHRSKTAGRLPAHASSCGLVLLAYAPKHVREAYLRGPLNALTERTTTEPAALRTMLSTIRAQHFAEPHGAGLRRRRDRDRRPRRRHRLRAQEGRARDHAGPEDRLGEDHPGPGCRRRGARLTCRERLRPGRPIDCGRNPDSGRIMRTEESAMTSEQLDSLRTLRMYFSRLIMQHRFVVDEMLTKISILREESVHAHSYNPIEHISSRVKSPRSLLAKIRRRGLPLEIDVIRKEITDIAGIRITCSFIADTYHVLELLTAQDDIRVVEIKDYIAHPKPNGYRSLHAILEVPVFLHGGPVPVICEVQIRTIAMD